MTTFTKVTLIAAAAVVATLALPATADADTTSRYQFLSPSETSPVRWTNAVTVRQMLGARSKNTPGWSRRAGTAKSRTCQEPSGNRRQNCSSVRAMHRASAS
jgi:hypothetical protein